MKNIAMFSGGKDSTALIIYLQSKGIKFEAVFCNTGWELPETLVYINYINEKLLDGGLTILKSKEYNGFEDMILKKKFFPGVFFMFCTEQLKVKVVYDYIKKFKDDVTMFNGVRKAESVRRRNVRKEVYDEEAGCLICRPLIDWSDEDVFKCLKVNKVEMNPLYKMGFKRVGCGPCFLITLKELAVLKKTHYDRIDRVRQLEWKVGSQFFNYKIIPERYHSAKSKAGRSRASIDDVIKYIESKEKYFEITEQVNASCMSYYGLCE